MNVASTSSFQPGPTMAVYCATKAYVLSFTEAVSNEVNDKGVSIIALCPGATDTGFQAAGGLGESKLFKDKKLPTAKEVAEYGYSSMMKGKTVAIHGFMNYIMSNSIRLLPRSLVLKVSSKMLDKD
jgi:short-subunit dehydrogenase